MEPMQGKLASSLFDFGYTEQFCIPGVTSVFFSSCDSLVGDSLEFNQANEDRYVFDSENAIALHAMQGNRASSRGEGEVSWVFSSCGTWGIFSSYDGDAHSKRNLFSEVRTLV